MSGPRGPDANVARRIATGRETAPPSAAQLVAWHRLWELLLAPSGGEIGQQDAPGDTARHSTQAESVHVPTVEPAPGDSDLRSPAYLVAGRGDG